MRVEISEIGTLKLIPENSTEAYALSQWEAQSRVYQEDPMRMQRFHYMGTSIRIEALDVRSVS